MTPTMKCSECRGACCESFLLPVSAILAATPTSDAAGWLALHATPTSKQPTGLWEFEARCCALGDNGSCTIYADRPQMCRDYEPGGDACLDTVRRRRSPAQYAVIRDEDDPTREELYADAPAYT